MSWGADSGATPEQLSAVINLAEQQQQLEIEVADLEQELERKQAQLKQISERDLPETMEIAGILNYTLSGGRKVAVETKVTAWPSKESTPDMLVWLRQNGHEDIIKNEVKIAFGRGQDDQARELLDWIDENLPKHRPESKQYVHFQTLGEFVREMMAQQVDLPDAFGVTVLKKSVITAPKNTQTI